MFKITLKNSTEFEIFPLYYLTKRCPHQNNQLIPHGIKRIHMRRDWSKKYVTCTWSATYCEIMLYLNVMKFMPYALRFIEIETCVKYKTWPKNNEIHLKTKNKTKKYTLKLPEKRLNVNANKIRNLNHQDKSRTVDCNIVHQL